MISVSLRNEQLSKSSLNHTVLVFAYSSQLFPDRIKYDSQIIQVLVNDSSKFRPQTDELPVIDYFNRNEKDELNIIFPMRVVPVHSEVTKKIRCAKITSIKDELSVQEYEIAALGTFSGTNKPFISCNFKDYSFTDTFYAVITTSHYHAESHHDTIYRVALEESDNFKIDTGYHLKEIPAASYFLKAIFTGVLGLVAINFLL